MPILWCQVKGYIEVKVFISNIRNVSHKPQNPKTPKPRVGKKLEIRIIINNSSIAKLFQVA